MRCLTQMPHSDHTIANTLEFLHEDKQHHSQRAIEERKKLHQPLRNDTFRRRPSTPTHAFAATGGDGSKFWSHAELAEAKRKLQTPLTRPKPGEVMEASMYRAPLATSLRALPRNDDTMRPQSARSGSVARSQSEDGRPQSVRSDQCHGVVRSPTIAQLIHHQRTGEEEHPHNASAEQWWQTVREKRDEPHQSAQKFNIQKRHHTAEIRDTPSTQIPRSHYDSIHVSNRQDVADSPGDIGLLMTYERERDPRGFAIQGDYPNVVTHETRQHRSTDYDGNAPTPTRYTSIEMLSLDKRRHCTTLDDGKRDRLRWGNVTSHVQKKKPSGAASDRSRSEDGRSPAGPGSPTYAGGMLTGGGISSQRELQYRKRFNAVPLKTPQQLHVETAPDRPWPKPGQFWEDSGSRGGSVTSSIMSNTANPREGMMSTGKSTQAMHHHVAAITKYSPKSGLRRSSMDSNVSDGELLHSSQLELAERKAVCQTAVRHQPRPDSGATPRSRASAGGGSDIRLRRDISSARDVLNSHQQLEYSKTLHKFAHDDDRRSRLQKEPLPVPPTPRTGQWTPAHV